MTDRDRQSSLHPRSPWPPSTPMVELARAGNRDALSQILAAGHPRLVAFFRGAGPRLADAEDLAAHVCEAVVKGIPKLRDAAAFEGWFWAIARTTLRGWIRRHRRDPRMPPVGTAPRQPDDATIESEEHAYIRAALDQLSMRDRQLLWLREVEGLSYEDIGGQLGAAIGTVRVACHRARTRLESAFADLVSNDGER